MSANLVDVILEVENLKREFERRGLDLAQVWRPTTGESDLERRQLRHLLDWVEAYERLGSRKAMQKKGYDFPPIDPDCDPWTDWLRFETWLKGEPISMPLREKLNLKVDLRPAETMSDAEIKAAIDEMTEALAELQWVAEPCEGMPDRLYYEELIAVLDDEYEILAPGTTCHLNGCTGYCPGCLRRPWCFNGRMRCSEDVEAHRMVVPDKVRSYVTDADLAFELLDNDPGL
jgi:hypothetical protein